MRADREDLTQQRETVWDAQAELRDALEAAAAAAKAGRPSRLQPNRTPDLTPFYASVAAVQRTEEALDLALLDLATAGGEDA